MASKREYLLQKGLQLKALTESVEGKTPPTSGSGTMTGKNAREVAKIRETCPPGTEDNVILSILAQTKGDPTKVSAAVSELWEDNRGHAHDEWATVEKKGKKKTEQPTSRREGGRSAPRSAQKQVAEEENPEGVERTSGERGSTRGRGAPASRGGRGGAGGRGRGSGRGFAPRSGARTNNGEGEKSGESDENPDDQSTSKGDKPAKKGESKSKPAQVAVAPQPEVLNLTGAWTKKPTFLSAAKPVQAPAPAPKPAPKPVEKPAPAPSSPVKKAPPAPSTPVAPLSPVATAVTSPKVLSPQTAASTSPKKVASPAPVSKVPEKILSPKKIDSPTPAISGWGSLDVSTASMGDWSTATTEKKTVPVTNAWARGSPLIASTDKPSPLAPSASPASPKEIRTEVSAGSNATSPKYLKLGRWDTGATTNMALQFGSFSLNNEQLDSKSPRGWASTTTSAPKPTTTSEAPNAWGTQSTSPKKAASSPKRTVESDSHGKANVGNNGPPGLSVESGRTTPKAALSPRSFAPSAPSPASLPKPDDVKRNTPTRAQGSFQNQTQSQPQSGSSKIGSGSSYGAEYNAKSTNLYQPTYGQYAMGMSGPATTQSQISGSSNTPKGAAPRSSGPTSTSISSPTNSAQQAQQQFHAQQTQAQQPKPTQQQTQQVPQHQQQQQQQQQQGHSQGPQQNPSQHHQQHAGPPGYHPHYAPPPPPGMAMAYNPYNNYANYYQGYGYYPNPQYAQYSPRAQYPPRGNVPYGVEGPMPGFPNPSSLPVGYQDQHLAHQHDYAGAVPQGFGEISGGGYLQQPSHHHPHQQGPQNHGKGPSQVSSQPRSSGMQGYQSTAGGNARDQSTPGAATSANPSTGVNAGYGQQQQHYGWSGSYGGQPMGGWGHMGPQGYQQQNPSHQHPGSHQPQQSYRQYSGNQAQSGNPSNESGGGSGHGWSS